MKSGFPQAIFSDPNSLYNKNSLKFFQKLPNRFNQTDPQPSQTQFPPTIHSKSINLIPNSKPISTLNPNTIKFTMAKTNERPNRPEPSHKRTKLSASKKGKAPAQGSVASLREFPSLIFGSPEQKARFLKLEKVGMNSTRWLCFRMVQILGLKEQLEAIFRETSFRFLWAKKFFTYRLLTLEFLSSFEQSDDDDGRISFRLLNKDFDLSVVRFGRLFDIEHGFRHQSPDGFLLPTMWACIADRPYSSVSNAKINAIQHPALRIFLRTLGSTIFGRAEPANSNKNELTILGSYLNVQRMDPWTMDLVEPIVNHFLHVAKQSKVSTIEIGGIVTYLAHRLIGEDCCAGLEPLHRPVPLIDMQYIRSGLGWINRLDHWIVSRDRTLDLPVDNLPYIAPLPPLLPGERPILPNYLLNHLFEGRMDGGEGAVPMPQPFGFIPPEGAPASASRPSSSSAPASAPPAYPWMNFENLAEDITRLRIDNSLALYHGYHQGVLAGGITPPYASFYTGPGGVNGGYPGRAFENTGISPEEYTDGFWERLRASRLGQNRNPDEDDHMDDDS